jgi:hypothetical protein
LHGLTSQRSTVRGIENFQNVVFIDYLWNAVREYLV